MAACPTTGNPSLAAAPGSWMAAGHYYLHLFAREQADLNWENPAVRAEVKNIIHFWAKKGGQFPPRRHQPHLKDQAFPDDEVGDGRRFHRRAAHPRILQDVRRDVFAPLVTHDGGRDVFHQPGTLPALWALDGSSSPWCSTSITSGGLPGRRQVDQAPFRFPRTQAHLQPLAERHAWQGWSALFWCNRSAAHRLPVSAMRASIGWSPPKCWPARCGLQGTPTSIGGDRHDQPRLSASTTIGMESRNIFAIKQAGRDERGRDPRHSRRQVQDNSRTPMQWSAAPNAGFTSGMPGSKPAANYPDQRRGGARRPALGVLVLSGSHPLRKAPHLHSGDYQELLTRAPTRSGPMPAAPTVRPCWW